MSLDAQQDRSQGAGAPDPFTNLGSVTDLTGRMEGDKDDGSQTSGNDKYKTN